MGRKIRMALDRGFPKEEPNAKQLFTMPWTIVTVESKDVRLFHARIPSTLRYEIPFYLLDRHFAI